jgi:hypothetical protein
MFKMNNIVSNNNTKSIKISPITPPKQNTKPIIPFVPKKNTNKPYKLINTNNVSNHVQSNNPNNNLYLNNLPSPLNNSINSIREIEIIMSKSDLKKIPKLK